MQRDYLLNLFKDCDFEDLITEDNYENKIIGELPHDFSYRYSNGISKICIMPNNSKYVIKIPFNGAWNEDAEEFYNFCNANKDKKHYWDYCFSEMILYNQAKARKIEKIFCKTQILGYVNSYPIYIQEKAEIFSNLEDLDEDISFYKEEKKKTRDYCRTNGFYCFNAVWLSDAFRYYGQAKFNKLMLFLKDNQINDLHKDNIGYIEEKPVLVDFSDWRD